MHKYNKKLNGRTETCEVCGKVGQHVQHHLRGRRYSEDAIWVCVKCHARIHSDRSWAYQNGYSEPHNTFYSLKMKPVKKKACTHGRTYYDKALGGLKCQFCGQKVSLSNFSPKTREKGTVASSTGVKRMGFGDKNPPHLIRAAELKSKLDSLRERLKTLKDNAEKAKVQARVSVIVRQMRELQTKINEIQSD